jgi:hypothetical protein
MTAVDSGATPDAVDCSAAIGWFKIALINPGTVSSAVVGGGALTLKASQMPTSCQPPQGACPTPVISVVQGGLVADEFEATASFEAFQGGGAGSAAGLNLQASEAKAFIRQTDTLALEVQVVGMPLASVPVTATSGTLRIARHAGVVTVTATAGDSSVEVASPMAPPGAIQTAPSLEIVNRGDATVEGETSIRFTDFQFTSSAVTVSDSFDCDTLP